MSTPEVRTAWPLRLDLLARLEALIEGLGQALRMGAASLFVAPLAFLRASPPALIRRGVTRRRILPPLIFLLLACFPLPELSRTFERAMLAHDPSRVVDQRMEQLKSLGAWDVLVSAGPPFLTIWLAAVLAAQLAAWWLRRPAAPLRMALLYLGALAAAYGSIAAVLVLYASSVSITALESHPGLGGWVEAAGGIAIAICAIPALMALGLGLYLVRRSRGRWRHWRTAARRAAALWVFIVPLALMGFVAWAAAESPRVFRQLAAALNPGAGGWLDADYEKFRRTLWIDARHCEAVGGELHCWLVITSATRGEISLVEPARVSLRHTYAGSARKSGPHPYPLEEHRWRPALGEGATLVLPEGRPALLGLRLPLAQLCTGLDDPEPRPGGDWGVRFELLGVSLTSNTLTGTAFETYRGAIGLQADVIAAARRACAASAQAR